MAYTVFSTKEEALEYIEVMSSVKYDVPLYDDVVDIEGPPAQYFSIREWTVGMGLE